MYAPSTTAKHACMHPALVVKSSTNISPTITVSPRYVCSIYYGETCHACMHACIQHSYSNHPKISPSSAYSRRRSPPAMCKIPRCPALKEAAAAAASELSEQEAAVVRDALRDFNHETRKSAELAAREADVEARAYAAWVDARKKGDWEAFVPAMEEVCTPVPLCVCKYVCVFERKRSFLRVFGR